MSRDGVCVTCGKEFNSLASHYRYFNSHAPDGWNKCYNCGNKYSQLGGHWTRSSECNYPDLTSEQKDVIEGMLMSDSWINDGGDNDWKVNLETEMSNEEYLTYLNNKIFPQIGTTVSLLNTAEELAEQASDRDTAFGGGNPENYSDMYAWRTVGHPELSEYRDWYSTGKKVWPADIDITPLTLKHLYIGDGSFHKNDEYMKITTANEMDNREKIVNMFESAGIEIGNFRYDSYSEKVDIFFGKDESFRLFEEMGSPPPGFEYKWPEEYRLI